MLVGNSFHINIRADNQISEETERRDTAKYGTEFFFAKLHDQSSFFNKHETRNPLGRRGTTCTLTAVVVVFPRAR